MTDERIRERANEVFKCDMCAGSGQIIFYDRRFGPCHKCGGTGHDSEMEKALAFALSEHDAAIEQCCRDVCQNCANGLPVKNSSQWIWVHEVPGIGIGPCHAAAIRRTKMGYSGVGHFECDHCDKYLEQHEVDAKENCIFCGKPARWLPAEEN